VAGLRPHRSWRALAGGADGFRLTVDGDLASNHLSCNGSRHRKSQAVSVQCR
jgi:hypothetical protein